MFERLRATLFGDPHYNLNGSSSGNSSQNVFYNAESSSQNSVPQTNLADLFEEAVREQHRNALEQEQLTAFYTSQAENIQYIGERKNNAKKIENFIVDICVKMYIDVNYKILNQLYDQLNVLKDKNDKLKEQHRRQIKAATNLEFTSISRRNAGKLQALNKAFKDNLKTNDGLDRVMEYISDKIINRKSYSENFRTKLKQILDDDGYSEKREKIHRLYAPYPKGLGLDNPPAVGSINQFGLLLKQLCIFIVMSRIFSSNSIEHLRLPVFSKFLKGTKFKHVEDFMKTAKIANPDVTMDIFMNDAYNYMNNDLWFHHVGEAPTWVPFSNIHHFVQLLKTPRLHEKISKKLKETDLKARNRKKQRKRRQEMIKTGGIPTRYAGPVERKHIEELRNRRKAHIQNRKNTATSIRNPTPAQIRRQEFLKKKRGLR